MTVRTERAEDIAAIGEVNRRAFEQPDEADLVDRLRGLERSLSLVAVDEMPDGTEQVIGHLLITPVRLDPHQPNLDLRAIGPMAVTPEHQRQGIGSRLVEEAIARCTDRGVDALFVLGHPDFYPRFGFEPSAPHGITSEYEVGAIYFMMRELRADVLEGVEGVVKYDARFAGI